MHTKTQKTEERVLHLHFDLLPLMKVNCNDEDVVCQHSSMKIRYPAIV